MNMKVLSGSLIGLAMIFGTSAFAQTQNNEPCAKEKCPKTEKCRKGEQCKPGAKCDQKTPCPFEAKENCKNGGRVNPAMRAMANLNLTDAQKEQIKNLPSCSQNKKNFEQASRQEYLNNLKSILSPEQYTQFLENCFTQQTMGPRHHGQKPQMVQGRKFEKKDKKDAKDKKDKKDNKK